MDLLQGIRTRRSIGKVKPDPVERHLVEQLLEAATLAPNHFLTEPWRFFVMTGEGRNVLANAYTEIALEQVGNMGNLSEEEIGRIREQQTAKAFRAPLVIAVAAELREDAEWKKKEDLAAVHAAVQNLLLAAHGMNLGAIWRSGEPLYHPKMLEAFGLKPPAEMVGVIYIGYPDMTPLPPKRTPFGEKTVWLGWDERV